MKATALSLATVAFSLAVSGVAIQSANASHLGQEVSTDSSFFCYYIPGFPPIGPKC